MTICIYIYVGAAVVWALEPLGMTICIYIYICWCCCGVGFGTSRDDYIYIYVDAAVVWALEPLGMTICIYIYMLVLLWCGLWNL